MVPEFHRALLQTLGTTERRHLVGRSGSIGEMLIEHNHGFGQGRGSGRRSIIMIVSWLCCKNREA